jgi:3',5'-cyclic AMP phosphodiesterase CpdA
MKKCLALSAFLAIVIVSSVAVSSGSGGFRFAVIGDNKQGYHIYSSLVDEIMRRKPDLVFNTGDLIPNPGNREQWKKFWELSKPINVPYYLVPGNHDIDDRASEQVWKDEVHFPGEETSYSVVYKGNLFIVLNTCDPKGEKKIDGEQLAWLKRTLASGSYDHTFVFLHHPLFLWKGATHEGDSLDQYPDLRDALHRVFKEGGVDIVFAGHEHTYRRMDVDGIRYVITGGGGARLYGGFNNFVLVEVDGDLVSFKVIDRKGALRDRFTMGEIPHAKHPSP